MDTGIHYDGWNLEKASRFYAYSYIEQDPDLSRLEWLNRSLNLCILSLLDTGIHYDGWNLEKASRFLSGFGITDLATQQELEWLNRSLNLCILSLLDTGIHYDGWNLEKASRFLSGFGITDLATQQEIYQVIVEDPANYLKYYMGYLHFLDLREACKKEMGEEFDIKKFHKKILEIGPS